ncbi:transglycosylase domain-containing protein [Paenibacillus paeoniae]|uniref:Carboxypeptidase n=1 Tax=Paenibacillus paeoniae TaxID=2292705 RepID=A0A371PJG6_9BACL|nr:transglycosylase domain-containing protein [Paenibacillus paeoniae]REK76351.1 carboxypeptidase [Paenibacillus paeoniae]
MQEDRQPSPKAPYSRWRLFGLVSFITVKWIVYFGIIFGLLAGGVMTGYVAALVKDEEIRPQSVIQNKVGEYSMTGYVYFRDDSLVGQLRTDEDRIVITYDEIPQSVIDALLSTEDNNFFEHDGVDINGLGRAVKQKLFNEDTQTGGSTLTQQLARRVFLSLDKTDSRKIKEIFLSLRMERYLTKQEILAAYLNKMPFGNGSNGYQVFGIKAAAKGIFGISDLSKLNTAQSAYLSGLPQLPSLYTAFTGSGKFNEAGFERAMKRQQLVLKRMMETGRLTQQQYEEALRFDVRSSIAPPSEKAYTTYPYLMLEAERQAAEVLLMQNDPTLTKADLRKKENAGLIEEAREQLLRGGFHVYTTIDKDVYTIMREIASNEDNFTPYSEKKGIEQIAGVMLDHKTGAIIGMLEGRDFYEEQMNFATQMIRQPGSTMKTLAAYLPAIEAGIIQPASIIDDAPIVLKDGQKGFHIPMNVTNKFRGLVTARDALNRSLNLPALKIFNEDLTIDKALEFVRSLGITTLQPEDAYSQTGVIGGLRLGVSVEEMTNAYGSIPNQGVFQDAYMIQKITDANGKIIYDHKEQPKRVFSEQSAFLMTDMLKTVISDPSGSGHQVSKQFKQYGKIPVAGKTGSTQSYGDVWFMGFTPDVTLGVWAGYEEQINSLSNNGQTRARSIWTLIMNKLTEEKPSLFVTDSFPQPDGVVKATVSKASGLLPTELTRSAGLLVTDWFNKEFLPKKADDALVNMKYITYQGINYVPNDLTPDDMLKEKIVIKRKKPLDVLMDEIKEAQSKLPAKNRRPLEVYVPADAQNDAPSKIDPRADDGAAPQTPSDVKLSASPAGDITITFSDSKSADVVGYRLYRSTNHTDYAKFGTSIHLGDETKFSFKASDKEAATYYVVAVDVVGKESAPSMIMNYGSTLPEIPEIPGVPGIPGFPGENNGNNGNSGNGGSETGTAPSAPTGLTAESSDLSILLSWASNPVSDQVTLYHIYYSANSDGNYVKLGTTSQTSFEHLAPLSSGSYQITAENSSGVSSPSGRVTVSQ